MEKRVGSSAGLLAVGALFFHTLGGTRPGHAPAEPKPISHENHAADTTALTQKDNFEGPWRATQQYFYRKPQAQTTAACVSLLLPADNPTLPAPVCGREDFLAFFGFPQDFEAGNLETLIATVQDPLHTRMSIATDRTLDAIQQGAYRSTWELAAHWLPWACSPSSSLDSPAILGTERADLERLPGLIVFRRHLSDGSRQRLLLIFVVGETPTGGISGAQFQAARRSIGMLSGPGVHQISIAGPNFSGSFQSLARLLEDDPSYSYKIRSGSVSNSGYAYSALKELRTAHVAVDFHGSTLPSEVFRERFKDLVHAWRYRDDQAVALEEDESGFSYRRRPSDSTIATYRYPRDIAQLRNAYSDVALEGTPNSTSATPAVTFSLKDTQAGEDVFPVFSSHTAASQNAVIQEIVQNLDRKNIRVVSLTATNVFDTIFLARVLWRYCRDIRVVLSGTDVLYVQDAVQGSLAGLMAISAYAMFPDGAAWDSASQRDFTTFADTDSVGEFNAVLTLLRGDAKYRQPFSAWLLVLGHNGWFPVRQLSESKPVDARAAKNQAAEDQASKEWFGLPLETKLNGSLAFAGSPWAFACLVIAALSIGFCARIYYLRLHPEILVWSSLCLSDLERPEAATGLTPVLNARYLCLFACLASLVFLSGVMLCPMLAARYAYNAPLTDGPLQWLMIAAFLTPVCAAAHLAFLVPGGARRRDSGTEALSAEIAGSSTSVAASFYGTIMLRSIILGAPIIGLSAWWHCCTRGQTGLLLCLRSVTLSPTVCPIWPLLLAGTALFTLAFFHLRRFTLAHRQEPAIETSVLDGFLWNQFTNLKTQLRNVALSPVAGNPNRSRGFILAAVSVSAAVAVSPLIIPEESLRSFEGFWYEHLLIGLLLPIAILIGLSFVQFLRYWSLIRTFLVTINSIALGRFFARLPDFDGTGPVWSRGVKMMRLATSINSAIALHNLELRIPATGVDRQNYWEALRTMLDPPAASRTRGGLISSYQNFRSTAAAVSGHLSRDVLSPYWAANELPFVDSDGNAANESGEGYDLYQTASKYVVLQYQIFIGYCMRHLQNLLLCCTLSFVLFVLALNSFGFQASQSIGRILIFTLCVGAVLVVRVLAEVERDPILSRLSGSTEGALGVDFYVKVLAYGALPVLTVISTQFPVMAGFINSWAQPALATLH